MMRVVRTYVYTGRVPVYGKCISVKLRITAPRTLLSYTVYLTMYLACLIHRKFQPQPLLMRDRRSGVYGTPSAPSE